MTNSTSANKSMAASMAGQSAIGLGDRLMFGSDNSDIGQTMSSVMNLKFLTASQMTKIFYENAERFYCTT